MRVANEILVVGLANNNMSLLSKISVEDYYKEVNTPGRYPYESSAGEKQAFRKILDKIINARSRKASTSPEQSR